MNLKEMQQVINRELEIIHSLIHRLELLNESHPEWYADLEKIDPDIASRRELMHLLETAPTDAARFFIFGKLTLRIQLAKLFGNDVEMLELTIP